MAQHKEILRGIYQHFKGNRYQVIELARHSETGEDYVVYRALYGDRGVWIRPATMFCENIERDGKEFERFTLIQPDGCTDED